MHTHDRPSGTGDYIEGEHYAVEYAIGVRIRDQHITDLVIPIFRDNVTNVTTNPTAFYEQTKIAYEVMMILYDLIDNGTSSRWSAQFSVSDSNRPRQLMVDFIFAQPSERSQQLLDIIEWSRVDTSSHRPAYRIPNGVTY